MIIVSEIRVFTLHGEDASIAFTDEKRVSRAFGALMFVLAVLMADCLLVSI